MSAAKAASAPGVTTSAGITAAVPTVESSASRKPLPTPVVAASAIAPASVIATVTMAPAVASVVTAPTVTPATAPWPDTNKESVREPVWTVEAVRSACIRVIAVIAPRAHRRRPHVGRLLIAGIDIGLIVVPILVVRIPAGVHVARVVVRVVVRVVIRIGSILGACNCGNHQSQAEQRQNLQVSHTNLPRTLHPCFVPKCHLYHGKCPAKAQD